MDIFDKKVKLSVEDLKKYSDTEIKSLSEYTGVNNGDLHKIATKIITANTNDKCVYFSKKINDFELKNFRMKIYNSFIRFKDNVLEMTPTDLWNLFKAYDKLFFNDEINSHIVESGYTLKFRTTGDKDFVTDGICIGSHCDYTITIPIEFFKNVNGTKTINVAGHQCKDQLECLQRVFEHELCHLVIFMFCKDRYITDQHGKLFMSTVNDLFRHTDYRHYLP